MLTKFLFFNAFIVSFFLSKALAQKPQFNRDIAPIIHQKCSTCHRSGQSGPFSLITYKEVQSKAEMIKKVINNHFMPPWKADPSYVHFENENVLSGEQIKLINDWVKGGTPKGPGKAEDPVFPENSKLGVPDAVVRMKVPFPVKGNNQETFAYIKLPYDIPSKDFMLDLAGLEFVPGNRKILHHLNYEILGICNASPDPFSAPYYLQYDSVSKASYNVTDYLNLIRCKSYLSGGWLPGYDNELFPEDMGVKIPRKGVIIFSVVHYGGSAVNDTDNSSINIFLKKKPFRRSIEYIPYSSPAGNMEITPSEFLPADSIKTFVGKGIIRYDASLIDVIPHMHLLGKKFLSYAITPSGDTIPLLKINDWDFNWQQFYKFKLMVHLPANSTLVVEATYDNTAQNPKNAFHPPRTMSIKKTGLATDGMRTTDEMFGLGMHVVHYEEGDEKIK